MNKLLCALLLLLGACGPEAHPRPKGELRIALPAHAYQQVESPCPYSLDIPQYAHMTTRLQTDSSCWADIVFPQQKAVIHLTYRKVDSNLAQLLDESLGLTYEHHIMADDIANETVIHRDSRVYGTLSKVHGNVASNVQFYVTDSTEHFLRGALYFNTSPNKDSLAPVIAHLTTDIEHLLGSVRWRE